MSPAELEVAAATLRAYLRASGALGVSALVGGVAIDCEADGALSTRPLGDEAADPEPFDPGPAAPRPLDVTPRPVPPLDVDAEAAEVHAPFGALEHLVEGVAALARALGDRAVAVARFPTADGVTPFAIAAREGEGTVVVLGDEQFEMAPGWPRPSGPPAA